MARDGSSRGATLEILADAVTDKESIAAASSRTTPSPSKKRQPALRDLSINTSQNNTPIKSSTLGSLAADLEKLHIHSPKKVELESILQNKKGRGLQARAPIGNDTFVAPGKSPGQKHAHFAVSPASTPASPTPEPKSKALEAHPKTHHLNQLRVTDPIAKEQLAKHRAGQFQYILEVPVTLGSSSRRQQSRSNSVSDTVDASEAPKLWFGCNVLHRRTRSEGDAAGQDGAANAYILIATPLEKGEDWIDQDLTAAEDATMENASSGSTAAADLPLSPGETNDPTRVSPKSLISGNETGGSTHLAPRSPAPPVLRIEDSFEELDRLEEQFEAVDSMVQVERVPSPDKPPMSGDLAKRSLKKTTTATKKPPLTRGGSVRVKSTEPSRTGTISKSTSRSPAKEEEKPGNKAVPKRGTVTRPASLLPPKPLAKSGKPSTMPTFELPGEAVARRLKEQKEARMSGMVTLDMTVAPSPQRIRSNKVPTRPTFELPGEAISRRKREEHEARLKAQQEEERRRREFKARPIRNSIAPGSLPRETLASRARQTKAAATGENAGAAAPAPAAASKRQSMAPSTRTALSITSSSNGSAPPRGRGTTPASPSMGQPSRATSTSTGSISGKRSTVSAEEAQHQKQRGREIYSRDNSITAGRDQERLQREAAAKAAREQAAERSRMLAAEWADKQKQRTKKLVPSSPSDVAVR